MGQPIQGNAWISHPESIGVRGERGEVKHLSTPRRRNQSEIPSVAARERGKGQNMDVLKPYCLADTGLWGQFGGVVRRLGKLPTIFLAEGSGKAHQRR